ncbi:DUF4157 domain-containing protein, partial [Myxococcota bacterium]|nr:DUF4157 domain-containing protein [Myxococcota bacterium]
MSRRPDPRREVAPAPALTTEPQRQHSLPSTTPSALVDGPGAWVGELHERVGNLALGQALMSPEADAGYSEQLTAALADAPMLSRALRSNRHNQAALRRGALPQDFQLPSGQGRPLPEPVQERVSAALGRDVSKMRVHDDPAAARAAESINAEAFAEKNHVFFGAGMLNFNSVEGMARLLHEATHVGQWEEGALAGKQGVSSPSDPTEQEATASEALAPETLEGAADPMLAEPSPVAPGAAAPGAAVSQSPSALAAQLAESVGGLPGEIAARLVERLTARLPEADPVVEAGDAQALAAPTAALVPNLAPAPPTNITTPSLPSSSLPTTASSVEEAFALVNQSFNAALDVEASARAAQRAAVTPPAPIAAAGLSQIVDTQASAEGQLITQRAEAAQVGLTEEGQTPEATAQPTAAPVAAPAAPPISARLSRREADEEGPAPPTTGAAPAVEVTPAEESAQATSPVVTETSPTSPTTPSTTTSQAVVPPTVSPAQTEAPALDLPAEAASASGGDGELSGLEFDKANADRERELAQSDLQRLEARQKEAEARAKAEGHPEDLHNAPTPHELQSAKDRVARAEEEAKEADTALQSAQNAASAPSGGGGEEGGGGGGGANPEALAAEAQAQAEAAAAEQAAALGAETTADQAALTAQAQAARAQVLAQAQLLAEQVRAAAATQASAVRDAGAQAADAARAQAQAEAESARAAAEAAASQAANASGPFDGPEEESQAQAAAEAEAASIRAEGEAKAEELIAAGEAKAEQLIAAAEAQAQQLIAQGELAAAQLIAAADAGAEAVAAQAALLTQQLQVNAAAHTAQLNAERDAAVVATETLLAEVQALAQPVVEPVNTPVVTNSTPAETPLGPDERNVTLVSAPISSGPSYPAPPGPAAPGEVVEPSVAAPYPRAAPQTSPLLDHLRGVTGSTLVDGPEAQAATAEALGVSVEALTVLQSNPSALTWSDLSAAGLSDADRAALQTAAALDLASGMDPDQPANLFLSWFDWEIATQADFRATQPQLGNSIHLDNAGMDEVAALMGVAEFQRLVLSTHGLPGGQLMKPEDGPGHQVYDARVMAELAEQSGVDSVLLAHCYGALGADGVNTLDVDYRAASGSSVAEFAARGMDVSAYEGAVSSTTATTMVGLWSELLAAGVPDDAALQLAGAYANANGNESLNSIDWQHYAPHARAELGPENDPQAWANENGFVETQVGGERSTPAHMLPLLAEYGHLLMATPTVTNAPMAFTGNDAANQADLFARMTINDLVYGGLYPSAGNSGQDAQMVVRLLEDAWTGAPLVEDGQLPSWATLGPRLYFALEGQVSAIEQMTPEQRAQNATALENLQLMRDAVWIQLAAEGQGVTDEHGQMAFLPPTDLTVDPTSPSTATNATGNTTVVNGVTVADPTRITAPDVSVDPLAPTQGLLFSEAISDGATPVPPQAAALYTDLLTGNPDTIRAALD